MCLSAMPWLFQIHPSTPLVLSGLIYMFYKVYGKCSVKTFGTFRHRAERVRQVGTRPPHSADRAARPRPAGNPTGSKTGFLLPPGTVACFQRARVCTATHRARPAQLRATPAP